jgi:hypothetical protein
MVRSLLLAPQPDREVQQTRVDDDTDTKPLQLAENGHRRQVRVPDRFVDARREP